MKECFITGRGVITVYGMGNSALWNNVVNKTKNFKTFSSQYGTTGFAGIVDEKMLTLTIEKEEKRKLDRFTLLTLECIKLALADAGLDLQVVDKNKVGVIFSTYHGEIMVNYKEMCNLLSKGPGYVSAFWFPATTYNFPAGAIARYFKLHNVFNSCIVGCFPIWYGVHMIQQGILDIVILVSADEFFDGFHHFFVQNGLSKTASNNFPLEEGLVYSEAWSTIVIETKESVSRRDAKIYAKIEKVLDVTSSGQNSVYQKFYRNFVHITKTKVCDFLAKEISKDRICLWIGSANGIADSFYDEIDFVRKVLEKASIESKLLYTNVKGYIGETFSPSSLINLIMGTEIFQKGIVPGIGKITPQCKEYVGDTNLVLVEENINENLNTIVSAAFLPNGAINITMIRRD